jgi:hypothetical protein
MLPNRIARRKVSSTPLILIDDPSVSGETNHLDASNVLPVHHVSSGDERMSHVPCLQLLLTV